MSDSFDGYLQGTVKSIRDRVWAGRRTILSFGIKPERVRIVLSVHLHMALMTQLRDLRDSGIIESDPSIPGGVRIWGIEVERDPSFHDDEIRFRSEVVL